ncbi:MAG: MFS transporter [Bilophila sp.]
MNDSEQKAHDKNLRRVVVSSLIGAVIEWYDFFLYGVVAGLFFNQLYFPGFDPRVGTMLAFATFAVGFVARPLGGLVFGHFGDKIGRKKVLVLTLQIMGLGTVAIGCIPSYAQIGLWAPVLLIICRMAQGLGLGGEWGGAVLMSFESAPPHKRAFYASLPQIGLALGLLLASGIIGLLSAVLPNEAFLSWGWRIAFILSAGLLFVGSYIRTSVHETKDFAESKASTPEVRYPLLDAFKRYPRMMLACMGARFIDGVAFNVFAVFSLTYLTQNRGLERSEALTVVMIASVIMSFFIPFWGMVADRVGKGKVFGFAALLLGFAGFPAFWVFHNHSDSYLMVCLALGLPFGIIYAAVFGTMSSLFSDSFDPSVRYSAISFVYQFSGIFAAGLTPMVATMLIAWGDGAPWLLCSYLATAGCVSAICTFLIRRMNKKGFPPATPAEERCAEGAVLA